MRRLKPSTKSKEINSAIFQYFGVPCRALRLQEPTQRTIDAITIGVTKYLQSKYPGVSGSDVADLTYVVLKEIMSIESRRGLSLPDHIRIPCRSPLLRKFMIELIDINLVVHEIEDVIDQKEILISKLRGKMVKMVLTRVDKIGFAQSDGRKITDDERYAEIVQEIIPRRHWGKLIDYAVQEENLGILEMMHQHLLLTEAERNIIEPKLVEWKLRGISIKR